MFSLITGCWQFMLSKRTVPILILGIDNSGKTTLFEQLKKRCGQKAMALRKIPSTIGLNIAKLQHNNLELVLWDLGGKEGIRNIWANYYSESQVVLYIIDGVDRTRLIEAKEVFQELLNVEELKSKPFHVLINKHDQSNCVSLGFIREYFCLDDVKDHEINVLHISALTQEGLDQVLSSPLICNFA